MSGPLFSWSAEEEIAFLEEEIKTVEDMLSWCESNWPADDEVAEEWQNFIDSVTEMLSNMQERLSELTD